LFKKSEKVQNKAYYVHLLCMMFIPNENSKCVKSEGKVAFLLDGVAFVNFAKLLTSVKRS
jgi:hypothetical protein